MSRTVLVANAPCSYGAFEVTVGTHPGLPTPTEVLDHIAASGYDGTDLGPLGWLGDGPELAGRLAARGLGLAGGYLALPFSEPGRLEGALSELDRLLDVFDEVRRALPDRRAPRPTLADAGSPARAANPGRAAGDRSLGLDEAGWRRLADGVSRAVARCRERGYEPTFHHHAATYVEAPWEVERLLELTDVGLCLDTGHLLLGGGDPAAALQAWAGRINHLHLKDCSLEVVRSIVADRAPVEEVWRRHAFRRLGTGDLDVDRFLELVRSIGFIGWMVVEQDGIPNGSWPVARAFAEQAENRAFLRARGF
ncbi:MAG TPA: sugar phosphate isomerase/epimerase [Actinomycetota bacterium]|nr:sugar phosphate isomerase/epimerase [Actinomycetota bacterium]